MELNFILVCFLIVSKCHAGQLQETDVEIESEESKNLRDVGMTSLPEGLFSAFGAYDYSPVVATDVNLTAYMGRWYEVASSLSAKMTFMLGCSCATADYALQDENSFVSVYNSCLRFGKRSNFYADAIPMSMTRVIDDMLFIDEAKLQLRMNLDKNISKKPITFGSEEGNYWILYFDGNLAIVGGPSVWTSPLFFLSRTPQITPEQYQTLKDLSISTGIPAIRTMSPFLTLSSQFDCEYPPQP